MALKSGYGDGYLTSSFAVTGVCGTQLEDPTPEQHHETGHVVRAADGTSWTYVQAHAAIAVDGDVAIASPATVNGRTVVKTASGSTHNAKAVFAEDDFGWVVEA